MSRLFEALQQSSGMPVAPGIPDAIEVLRDYSGSADLEGARPLLLANVPGRRLVSLDEGNSAGAEKFRLLATRMKYLQEQLGFKKVVVTSCTGAEGKSLTMANLAISLAVNRQRVLLIDGDLRQRTLARLFDVAGSTGIAEWVQGNSPAMKYLLRAHYLPLWLLPAGRPTAQPAMILKPYKVAELISQLSGSFDWVLIDSPPMIPFAESVMWAAASDRVLLVAREGVTPRRLLKRTLDAIDKRKLLGTVLNDTSSADEERYYRYYAPKSGIAVKAGA